ncbi:MAG: hypothetical protein IKK19_04460 [Bacteroidales bacterium]|nr:hypothetical protein [Bacteroidales bacterium]
MMKNLLYKIKTIALPVLLMAGICSCTDFLQGSGEVQVGFDARICADPLTRTFGRAEKINTIMVGIFKKGVSDEHTNAGGEWRYHEVDRLEFPMSGTSANIQLTLAKDQTYSFIFWAYDKDAGIYNTEKLTSIKMNPLPDNHSLQLQQAESADAFFAVKEGVTIMGSGSYPVELERPLAQVNVGTTGKVVQATLKAKGVPDTFYPFTNSVSGAADRTWNFNLSQQATKETFTADGTQYNYLAMGYLFAPTTQKNIAVELTLTDGSNSNTVQLDQTPIEVNKKTNIAGKLTQDN